MPTRWILRHGDVTYPLEAGLRVIGRAVDVDVPLNDDLVSRKHAELDVSEAGVRLRDLGSRNGLMVNDERAARSAWVKLRDTDRVKVGTTSLVLLHQRERSTMETVEAVRRRPTVPAFTVQTGLATTYETFLAEAARAANMGDHARLESATDMLLDTLRASLKDGGPPDVHAVTSAVAHALVLAERDARGLWLVRVFELAAVARYVLPVDGTQRVERLLGVRRASPECLAALDEYVAVITPSLEGDPRGRALLRQLERLKRLSRPPLPAR